MKSLRHLFAAVVVPVLMIGLLAGCSGLPKGTTKTLTSIAVTPASPAHLKVGATQQFTATGTYSDNTTADITATVTWTSGTPATATISTAGLATGVAAGTTAITATTGSVTSPAVTLTVISLQSIAVTPATATIAIAATQQYTATGMFSDSSTADISSQVTWSCLPAATATISATGLATGVANGTAQVSAKLGSVTSNSVTLTVGTGGVPVPVAVKIQQVNPTIPAGGVEDFTAVALLSDGTTAPLGTAATWSSGTTANATIITTATAGIASGIHQGTSTITATSGTLAAGTTVLTVVPAVPRFVYTIGPNDGVTSGYALNGAAGALAPIPSTVDPGASLQLVFEPSGQFAYGPGSQGSINTFSVNPVTGVLSPSGLPGRSITSFVSGTSSIGQSVVDPTGRYLYVVDGGTRFVNAYSIDTSNNTTKGSLKPIASSPKIGTGLSSFGIAINPAGTLLYVTNNGDNTISGYAVGSDGGLTALTLSTAEFSTLNVPGVPAIDPGGKFLFVPNNGGNTITVFSINSGTGALTHIGAPDIATNLNRPFQAVTDPTGSFLFVTNSGKIGPSGGTVAAFSISGSGGLAATTTANSGSSSASVPFGIAIDPTGSFASVVNDGENTVTLFSLAAGVLTPKFTVGSRDIAQFTSFYSGTASPVIGPSNVFAANSGSGNISGFVANNVTGVLGTAVTATGQSGNALLGADIAGNFLYASSPSGPSIGGFSVTPATAALAAISSFHLTTATDHPANIVTEPTSRTLLVADTTGNLIETFSAGGSPASKGTTTFASVKDIAVDSQGTYAVAFGTNAITAAAISGFTGTLTCVQQPAPALPVLPPCPVGFSQAGNWTTGAVDPTGRWIVALDFAGKTLQPIAFTPIQNGFTSPDGTLTAAGSPVATGLTAPSSVTFDPLGRFVFVSDATAGTVTSFTFNESTGAINTTGKVTTVSATGTGRVSIDASGTYLYAAVTGNGGSVPSGVAAYKINSDGSLTAVAGSPFATGAGTSGTAGVAVTSSVQ
ncbi:MAG: hypothetical protein NVS9B14_14900 [Candidatus Acidiferrum sp.]